MTGRSSHVVLIVEHNEFLRLLTADIMKDAGFVALHASDADEAITVLESRSDIALMLTSVKMPGSTGWCGSRRYGVQALAGHQDYYRIRSTSADGTCFAERQPFFLKAL
jgi:CheY-like chemotaxis protein